MSLAASAVMDRFKNAFSKLKWEIECRKIALDHRAGRFQNTDSREFTIGMVTYIVRFPLLRWVVRKVRRAFPGVPIVMAVNGYYDEQAQRGFLLALDNFLRNEADIQLIPHVAPQSLSRLWNEILLAARTEKTFIVNDDIDVAPRFGPVFRASGILDREMAIVNSSWSHFVISKRIVERVGWFDERLYGVGGEDWDYEARLAHAGIPLDNVHMKGILNMSIYTTDFSYGPDVERVERKYTLSSAAFLARKWRTCAPSDPRGCFVRIWNNHVCMNPGFETPVFYDPAWLRHPDYPAGGFPEQRLSA